MHCHPEADKQRHPEARRAEGSRQSRFFAIAQNDGVIKRKTDPRGLFMAKKSPGHFWISVYENGVCGANGIYQFPKQPIKYLHRIEVPIVRLKPFYSSYFGRLMGVPAYIKSEDQSYYGKAEQSESYYHFLTPFKIISPAVKNSSAPIMPNVNMLSLSGKLVNTYIAMISFEISRRYLPKFVTWLSLNSIVREYLAPQYLSRVKKAPNPF